MKIYTPDKFVVFHNPGKDDYRVFGSWRGRGLLDGDHWRINSGIKRVTEEEGAYLFEGDSGSIYQCRKGTYGVAGAYNQQVLNQFEGSHAVTPLELDQFEQFVENFNEQS